MFRGCDDQTKRYLFYYLGLWSGQFGYLGYTASLNKMFQEHQGSDRENIEYRDFDRRFITIHDRDVKRELNLSPTQSEFFWYELLGFSTVPTQREAEKKFRQMFRIYHPDITTKNYLLAEKVMKVISEAKIIAHTEINLNEDLSVPQLLQ